MEEVGSGSGSELIKSLSEEKSDVLLTKFESVDFASTVIQESELEHEPNRESVYKKREKVVKVIDVDQGSHKSDVEVVAEVDSDGGSHTEVVQEET